MVIGKVSTTEPTASVKVTSYPDYGAGWRENAKGTLPIRTNVSEFWRGSWHAIGGDYSGACEHPSSEISINEFIPNLLDNFVWSKGVRVTCSCIGACCRRNNLI